MYQLLHHPDGTINQYSCNQFIYPVEPGDVLDIEVFYKIGYSWEAFIGRKAMWKSESVTFTVPESCKNPLALHSEVVSFLQNGGINLKNSNTGKIEYYKLSWKNSRCYAGLIVFTHHIRKATLSTRVLFRTQEIFPDTNKWKTKLITEWMELPTTALIASEYNAGIWKAELQVDYSYSNDFYYSKDEPSKDEN